jgi:SpoU rRNA methylase family enzyme
VFVFGAVAAAAATSGVDNAQRTTRRESSRRVFVFGAVAAAAATSGVNNAQRTTRRESSRRVFVFEGEARAWRVRVDSLDGCHYFS